MNKISQQRFAALAGYSRRPTPIPFLEREWYEVDSERLLGIVVQDQADKDFAGVVLARDGNGLFRWVDGTGFFENVDGARAALEADIEKQAKEPPESFEQGDEVTGTIALLKPIVSSERMGAGFRTLVDSQAYSPARGLIEALSPYFRDLDGNFIEQFQTTAFDARIFELYLFAMLHEVGYAFDQSEAAPDYHCLQYGVNFFVEATTVQPTAGAKIRSPEETLREVLESTADKTEYFSIKFGSALFSKLSKKYWERPHVVEHPLVFAIQNFSEPLSMQNSNGALTNYLYGWRHGVSRDDAGHLVITPSRIGEHRFEDKTIPSDFFSLPGAENISAVLFNPHATLPKFNRMGILAGFGSTKPHLVRRGLLVNHDPDASEGIPFSIDVRDPAYRETWIEGLNVYHNPRARFPLDEALMPGAAHHFLEADGMVMSHTPEYFPLSSITLTLSVGETEPG